MKDYSSQRRRSGKYGKPGSKKKGKRGYGKGGGYARDANGNRAPRGNEYQPGQGTGVCMKCGHPAPDGKLCQFHRSLLNALRADFGKKGSRNYSPAI